MQPLAAWTGHNVAVATAPLRLRPQRRTFSSALVAQRTTTSQFTALCSYIQLVDFVIEGRLTRSLVNDLLELRETMNSKKWHRVVRSSGPVLTTP